jgi:glycosyltransferase involved in cell wall biosynthesis
MYIVHLGFSGFPKGMASTQRLLLSFKGLKKAGEVPLVINKISHNQYPDEKKVRRFEGITYINTPYLNSKPNSFITRNINKVSGYIGEIRFLYKKRKKIGSAILYSTYFLEYPYYFLLSRFFGFKLILQYVEMFSAVPGRSSFFTKINDRLIDRYAGTLSDGVIAISNYLADHVKKNSPRTPVIKIPANSDFSAIESIAPANTAPYLMYCGTIYYEEVIEFVVLLFLKLRATNKYAGKLLLIISGNHDDNWNKLRKFLKNDACSESVIVKSNIPYAELVGAYKAADLLLIPLRNTVQDIARFPHKVGEYTASKRPILSTNLGELKAYFKDGESALLADEFSLDSYYDKISGLLLCEEKLDNIGMAGNAVGQQNFDYVEQGKALKKFIDQLPHG